MATSDKSDGERHAFEATVIEKLNRIETTLAERDKSGSAFEQVTRERLDGMKWTAGIVAGTISLVMGAIGFALNILTKK